jgi:hypothetical protein
MTFHDASIIWRKSSRSGPDGDQCVEVAESGPEIGIRDSKNPDGPALSVSRSTFRGFIRRIKSNEYDG